MKIYTSYWAQVKKFPTNLIGLNTTVWPPRYRPLGYDKNGVLVLNCQPLMPGKSCNYLCRGACEPPHPQDCAFLQAYRTQLDKINFNEFYSYMEELSKRYNNADFAFIVFEPPTRACSERGVIQKWFHAHNIECEEWQPNI